MAEIRVYNTLSQEKEVFVPRKPGQVSIYVCGVTPYSDTHLGHARPSVVWDVIIRFFRWLGYETLHVQNFTDVDDKIIKKAQEEGVSALEISKRYIAEYLASMDAWECCGRISTLRLVSTLTILSSSWISWCARACLQRQWGCVLQGGLLPRVWQAEQAEIRGAAAGHPL